MPGILLLCATAGLASAAGPAGSEDAKPALGLRDFRTDVEPGPPDKRRNQMEMLQKIIASGASDDEMPKLLFRLAELQWEESVDAAQNQRAAESAAAADGVIATCRQIIQRYPRYAQMDEVLFFLGDELWREGKRQDSLGIFKALITRYPRSRYFPDAWVYFGEFYFDQDGPDALPKALASYKHVADFPNARLYRYGLYKEAWCALGLGKAEEAAELFQSVVSSSNPMQAMDAKLTEDARRGLSIASHAPNVEAPPAPLPVVRQAPPPAEIERTASATAVTDAIAVGPVTKMKQDDAYAVVVGIESYRRQLPQAEYAEGDARAFKSYLVRTLGVPENHIKLLVGADATRAEIEAVLNEWLPSTHAGRDATVYFYFSGHGAPDPTTGAGYLVPYDGDPAYLKSTAIPVTGLYGELTRMHGRRVLAFLDACFSGTGPRSVLAAGMRPLVPVKTPEAPPGSLGVLAAASSDQVAGPAPDAPHGLFTEALLQGLSGLADRDGDHTVSLYELQLFVTRKVSEAARKQNREQEPRLTVSKGIKPGTWTVVDGLVDP